MSLRLCTTRSHVPQVLSDQVIVVTMYWCDAGELQVLFAKIMDAVTSNISRFSGRTEARMVWEDKCVTLQFSPTFLTFVIGRSLWYPRL